MVDNISALVASRKRLMSLCLKRLRCDTSHEVQTTCQCKVVSELDVFIEVR